MSMDSDIAICTYSDGVRFMRVKSNSSNKLELMTTEENYYNDKCVSCISEFGQNKISILMCDLDFIGIVDRNIK